MRKQEKITANVSGSPMSQSAVVQIVQKISGEQNKTIFFRAVKADCGGQEVSGVKLALKKGSTSSRRLAAATAQQ